MPEQNSQQTNGEGVPATPDSAGHDQTGSTAGLSYRESGVDIDRANRAKQKIKELARSTFNASVVGDIGSFGGLFRPDFTDYAQPLLVSSADGVGTKLKIAFMTGIHNTVGRDLVAHCTNDILAQGAFPLFFLDYIACGKLQPEVTEQIVDGLAQGCRQSGCVLLGGETAEMPDFYREGEYDLAGFIVGLADESQLLSPNNVEAGDLLLGLPSSGLHTNGYSLVRKLFFEKEKLTVDSYLEELGKPLGEELLAPHRNYLPVLKELVRGDDLHGLAHITGGGITENLARILPSELDAELQPGSWPVQPIFSLIQSRGQVEQAEMMRTFNMGIGMILIVNRARGQRVESFLQGRGESFSRMGRIVPGQGRVRYL